MGAAVRVLVVGVRKPKSALTAVQTAVYFKLFNLRSSGRRITVRGLARLLGVDEKTIASGLRSLRVKELVDDDLDPNDPAAEQRKWFRPRPAKRVFRVRDLFPLSSEPSDQESMSLPHLDRAGKTLIDAGFSESQVESYFNYVRGMVDDWNVVFNFIVKFAEFFREVEAQHRANVAAGKYVRAKNCHGLLKAETRKRIAALRKTL